jgi:hypothetical protein
MQQRHAQRVSNVGQAPQLFHFFFMSMAPPYPISHLRFAIHTNAKTERQSEKVMKTKQILKISAAPATALFAMAFVAVATPAAAAASIDYCRHDVTSGMRGCGYTSLEQCQAMSSGRGGSCYENPFPENSAKASSSAYAYQPKHPVSKPARKPVDNR